MKTVIVTGAAGFLGSHLMIHHLREGDRVLGLDDYSSSREGSDHVKLIQKAWSPKQAMLITVDITDRSSRQIAVDDWLEMCGTDKVNLIYNFACPASPPIYQAKPVHTMTTCTLGVMNMLDIAREHRAIFIQASTSEVYGDPDHSPQAETYHGCVNSYGPRACYDEGKRAAEALCYDYLHTYQVDARLVRIFNTYGSHMDPHDGRVVSNFICQALRHEPLTIYGDGNQTRSFCYVDDLIRGIVAMGALAKNPMTPVNLGNPHEFTVNLLAREVLKRVYGDSARPRSILNDLSLITYRELPKDDPTQRRPDISLARELLGWEPVIQLEEGLDKTIEYFKTVVSRYLTSCTLSTSQHTSPAVLWQLPNF